MPPTLPITNSPDDIANNPAGAALAGFGMPIGMQRANAESALSQPNSGSIDQYDDSGTGAAPSVAVPDEEPTPGERLARAAMSALSGGTGHPLDFARATVAGALAAGANVGRAPAGGGFLYGASRGAAAVQEQQQQIALMKQKQAQQQFDNQEKLKADARENAELQDKTATNTALRAHLTQEDAASALRATRENTEFTEHEADRAENFTKDIRAIPGAKILGTATSLDSLMAANKNGFTDENGNKLTLVQAQSQGLIRGVRTQDGWMYAYVPRSYSDQEVDNPTLLKYDPQNPKADKSTGLVNVATQTKMTRGMVDNINDSERQKALNARKEQAGIAHEEAGTRAENARTSLEQEQLKQLKDFDTGNLKDPFGNKVGAPGMDKKEYVKRVDTYQKDYNKDLGQLDKAYDQLTDIINNAERTGKLPGADAVVGIFDAIGLSSEPLKGRGFRINSQVVGEHVEGTRNAWTDLGLKLSRLTPDGTGQIVSLQQLKDYQRVMDSARHDAYIGAGNAALTQGIGVQSVPRGHNTPLDSNTMDIFLTMANGDPTKAAAVAKQYGWTPPKQ
jgi:hypothetical protein